MDNQTCLACISAIAKVLKNKEPETSFSKILIMSIGSYSISLSKGLNSKLYLSVYNGTVSVRRAKIQVTSSRYRSGQVVEHVRHSSLETLISSLLLDINRLEGSKENKSNTTIIIGIKHYGNS